MISWSVCGLILEGGKKQLTRSFPGVSSAGGSHRRSCVPLQWQQELQLRGTAVGAEGPQTGVELVIACSGEAAEKFAGRRGSGALAVWLSAMCEAG